MAEGRKPKREMSLPARALKLLALREHTRLELGRKLMRYTEDADEIARVLEDFERRGWLSEARALAQTIVARRGRLGAQRIRRELQQKGHAPGAVAAVLPALRAGDLDAARAVWQKRFGSAPRTLAERAKQVRFLQGRGFEHETIKRVIGDADDDA
ncbi:MAG: recombination regulator RecX [Burkholderiales bacterium]